MPTGKTCGNCTYFVRVRIWGRGRNGLCETFDYSCHADSSYAKKCGSYTGQKYKRRSKRPDNIALSTIDGLKDLMGEL